MSVLTEEQVIQFLVDRLGFVNWESALENKVEFLKELVRLAGIHTHYENITWGAREPWERRTPTVEEIIKIEMETGGGACIHQNYFLKLLLEKLGFDAYAVAGEAPHPQMRVPRNHVITLVRLETEDGEEELYLVDTGFGGRPFMEPVNLSKLPYIGRAGGFDFEFRFNEALQRFERVGHLGCPLAGPYEFGVLSKVDFFFDTTREEFDDFYESYSVIFTDPEPTFFLNTDLISRFTKLDSPTDYEFIAFRSKMMIVLTAETRTEEPFETHQEMQAKIEEYFPNLDRENLATALRNYDNSRAKMQ